MEREVIFLIAYFFPARVTKCGTMLLISSGIWGLIAGPLLREGGILASSAVDGLEMLLWNAIGMGAIIAWNGVTSFILFGALHKVKTESDVTFRNRGGGNEYLCHFSLDS